MWKNKHAGTVLVSHYWRSLNIDERNRIILVDRD